MAPECPWHPSQPATMNRPTPSGKARSLSQTSKSRTGPRRCHVAPTRGRDGGADTGRGPRPLLPGATGRMGRRPASTRQVSTEAAARLGAPPPPSSAPQRGPLPPCNRLVRRPRPPPTARGREPRARAARDKRVAVIPLFPTPSHREPPSADRLPPPSCRSALHKRLAGWVQPGPLPAWRRQRRW